MADIPSAILNTFNKLRAESDVALVLRRASGRYYVYKTFSNWDKATKKVTGHQEYLGKITNKGIFIKKAEWANVDLKKAMELVQTYGGQITFQNGKTDSVKLNNEVILEPSDIDKKILTILSMNSRASTSFIAQKAKLTRSVVLTKIHNFEGKFKMKYTVELNVRKLGFRPYIILVKFDKERPNTEALRHVVSNEPRIQFAALIKGDYDFIMYWLDDIESLEITEDLWNFEINEVFKGYNVRMDVTPCGEAYSFIPIRNEFIEKILEKRIWKYNIGKFITEGKELKLREYFLIRELNENSQKDFTEIDRKYNLGRGASRYSYFELIKRGIIVRPTINLTNLPIKYCGVMFLETVSPTETEMYRDELRLDLVKYGPITNKNVFVGNIGLGSGSIHFMPVYNEGDLEKTCTSLSLEVRGTDFKGSIITETLVGTLCYRRFDNSYTRQYKKLVLNKKASPIEETSYDRYRTEMDDHL